MFLGIIFSDEAARYNFSPWLLTLANTLPHPTDGFTPQWTYWLLLERLHQRGFNDVFTAIYTFSSHSLKDPKKLNTRGNVQTLKGCPITNGTELAQRTLDSADHIGIGVVQHNDTPRERVMTLLLMSAGKCLGVADGNVSILGSLKLLTTGSDERI